MKAINTKKHKCIKECDLSLQHSEVKNPRHDNTRANNNKEWKHGVKGKKQSERYEYAEYQMTQQSFLSLCVFFHSHKCINAEKSEKLLTERMLISDVTECKEN